MVSTDLIYVKVKEEAEKNMLMLSDKNKNKKTDLRSKTVS